MLILTPGLAQEPPWDQLAVGLEVGIWKPGKLCQDQVPPLYVVRVDPERFRFGTFYFRDERLAQPPTIQEWRRRTQASMVFNAGLFREDYSYLGLLFKNGRSLGSRRHPQWQGLFAAEPAEPGLRKARILDLTVDTFNEDRPAYREVAQSLMLLDRTGRSRVRESGKQADQTVVGEADDGHILVMKTSEAVELHALAGCLHRGYPTLRQAMAMDGGSSSDLMIGAEFLPESEVRRQAVPWRALAEGEHADHIPLPSVIGIFPRTNK
jgi:uncharacterized protein YigE (DUF2233 family)